MIGRVGTSSPLEMVTAMVLAFCHSWSENKCLLIRAVFLDSSSFDIADNVSIVFS